MNQFEQEPARMSETEANSIMERLAAKDHAMLEASSLPSVDDIAHLLGVERAVVARELEILRYEERIAELDRQRKEEEARLQQLRSVPPEAPRSDTAADWARRQELMEAWAARNEPEEVLAPASRRKFSPVLIIVIVVFILLLGMLFISPTRTEVQVGTTPVKASDR